MEELIQKLSFIKDGLRSIEEASSSREAEHAMLDLIVDTPSQVVQEAMDLLKAPVSVTVSVPTPEPCNKCLTAHKSEEPHHPLFERYLRSVADYDNLQKRARQDIARAQEETTRKLFLDLIPVVDNIELALRDLQTLIDPKVLNDVKIIQLALTSLLQKASLTPIFEVWAPTKDFDSEKHQAIIFEESDQIKESLVIPLIQGYLQGSKVLRPAQVKVVKPK